MAVVAHEPHVITQTHADVTRDVVGTLSKPSRGYMLLLAGAVTLFLIGLLLLGGRVAVGELLDDLGHTEAAIDIRPV